MKNLISSIISLLMTLILSITCLYAWYTSNENVSTSQIIASSGEEDYSFKFSIFHGEEWLEITNEISFGEINPGDVAYFKLEATKLTDNNIGFKAYFSDLESSLSESLKVVDNQVCLDKSLLDKTIQLPLYTLENNEVRINDKTLYLYNLDDDKLELRDYKLEDALCYYEAKDSTGINAENKKTEFTSSNIEKGSTTTIYIAIEFNEESSLVEGYGSNLYAYQTVKIKKLKIDLI